MFLINWTDGASNKTFASGAGSMEFKFRDDKISHTLPTTRHRCNLKVWALAQSLGDGHRSLVKLERLLSEYNEDLIFFISSSNVSIFSHTRHWSWDCKCVLFSVNQQIRVAQSSGHIGIC